MSAPAFAWALERGATLALRPSDRLVLLYLADMANGVKVCWPGQPLIERYTGLKNNTVRAAVNRLAALQLIRVEATPGRVTRYHILRPDTPANGTGVTPANEHRVTPANGDRAPPQNSTGHPLNCGGGPPQKGALTPANGHTDPSYTQEEDPKTRAHAREEGKILSFGRKKEGGTRPPAPPTTSGSGPPRPPPDDFNAWVDGLPPKRSIPLEVGQDVVRGEVLAEEDAPVDPGIALAVLGDLQRSLRMRAYPPRAAALSPDEQADALCPRRPRPHYLPDAVLHAARAKLASEAAARRGVS